MNRAVSADVMRRRRSPTSFEAPHHGHRSIQDEILCGIHASFASETTSFVNHLADA